MFSSELVRELRALFFNTSSLLRPAAFSEPELLLPAFCYSENKMTPFNRQQRKIQVMYKFVIILIGLKDFRKQFCANLVYLIIWILIYCIT